MYVGGVEVPTVQTVQYSAVCDESASGSMAHPDRAKPIEPIARGSGL